MKSFSNFVTEMKNGGSGSMKDRIKQHTAKKKELEAEVKKQRDAYHKAARALEDHAKTHPKYAEREEIKRKKVDAFWADYDPSRTNIDRL